jgi:hypothetical protein
MAKLLSVHHLLHSRAPRILSKAETLRQYTKRCRFTIAMASYSAKASHSSPSFNVFDSHLHVWASPEQVFSNIFFSFVYFIGQESPFSAL